MLRLFETGRGPVALVTALCLALTPAAPLVAAPQQTTTPPPAAGTKGGPAGPPASLATAQARSAAAQPAATPAAPAKGAAGAPSGASVDGGWPRGYETPSGGKIVVYQPQVASWDDQKHMVAYAAVSYQPKGISKPTLGSLKLESDTAVSTEKRLVSFKQLQVTESNFPNLPKDEVREVVAEIVKTIPEKERVIALDRVLASLDKSQIIPKNVEGVKADPPPIFYSAKPAVLVNLDGDPIWSPIANNDLKFAVNTNWDLFQHEPTQTFYLRNDAAWLKAAKVEGPWTPAGKLPESFSKLPADDNWKDVKAALPGKSARGEGGADGVRQHEAGRADPREERPDLQSRHRDEARVGQQHRERRVPPRREGDGLLPRLRPLVQRGGLQRPVDVRDAEPPGGLPEDLARAPALARPRLGARHAAGGRGGAPRAGAADRARQQEGAEGARGRVPGRPEVRADREDERSRGRSTPTRTSSRSATSTTCASRACGSWRRAPPARGRSRARSRARSTRSPSAPRSTTSPT